MAHRALRVRVSSFDRLEGLDFKFRPRFGSRTLQTLGSYSPTPEGCCILLTTKTFSLDYAGVGMEGISSIHKQATGQSHLGLTRCWKYEGTGPKRESSLFLNNLFTGSRKEKGRCETRHYNQTTLVNPDKESPFWWNFQARRGECHVPGAGCNPDFR